MSYVAAMPEGYIAPTQLTLCSNVLRGVGTPIAIDGSPVLLVGKGLVPLIWLAAPIGEGGQRWVFIVAASQATNPAVAVSVNLDKRSVKVRVGGTDVLDAVAQTPDDIAVTSLDLRPLGLSIVGNATQLSFGGTTLAQNTFENVGTAFASGSVS